MCVCLKLEMWFCQLQLKKDYICMKSVILLRLYHHLYQGRSQVTFENMILKNPKNTL